MIDKSLISKGISNGIIQFVMAPNAEDVVCQIGEYWFYFNDKKSLRTNLNNYTNRINIRSIVNHLSETFDEFFEDESYDDDYYYCECVLRGELPDK